ncbi:hypothetical protein ACQEU6_07100 [Spirillospora sp. CA-108201]
MEGEMNPCDQKIVAESRDFLGVMFSHLDVSDGQILEFHAESTRRGDWGVYCFLREEIMDALVKGISLIEYGVARETLNHQQTLEAHAEDSGMEAFQRCRCPNTNCPHL